VLPQSSDEVSTALTALVKTNAGAGDWHIAVRSGGHSSSPGFNNIDLGVTIDLSHLNSTTYDNATGIARIDTGGRWRDVYATLDEHGVAATGGRDGDVGVGGFLLGGGISYFSGLTGFGCDSVVNFEVVLASGEIVDANSTANADLWRALKGGGSNFGIVTRFDMTVVPTGDFYYEVRYVSANYSDTIVDAVVAVADQDQSLADNAIVTFFAHDTSVSPDVYTVNIYVNTNGSDSVPTAYDKIRDLPAMTNVSSYTTMTEIAGGKGVSGGTRYVNSPSPPSL
jgi:FAD/FMN-containing dehydrogenase